MNQINRISIFPPFPRIRTLQNLNQVVISKIINSWRKKTLNKEIFHSEINSIPLEFQTV